MKGPETGKNQFYRTTSGFYEKYMSGHGLDIGYKGEVHNAEPVLPTAIGIDKDYPGYDGRTLPFAEGTQYYVFASHVLEHIDDPIQAIQEWFRVLRIGGHLVIAVPHMYLYEKKLEKPSRYNEDHKRFYGPATLLQEIDQALKPNTWRLRHYQDSDRGFVYSIPPEQHSAGAYEIECVIQKIHPPTWEIK